MTTMSKQRSAAKKTSGKRTPARGGKRPGAGRPSIDGKRRNVLLSEAHWSKAIRIARATLGAKGKAVDGIRIALDAYPE